MVDAIISGGTKGIGKIISQYLDANGYEVLALYRDDKDSANRCGFNTLNCDITNQDDINNLEEILDLTKTKPKLLVNNAGFNMDAMLWKMTNDQWDQVIDVTLKGTFQLSRLIVPYMRQQEKGCIINISTVVSQLGVPGTTNYSAAKAGLVGFTKSLAKELAPKGVRVNNLALGYFDTGIIKSIPEKHLEKIINSVPLKRLGKPDDLISAIVFLMGNDFVTGQTINVNGGLY